MEYPRHSLTLIVKGTFAFDSEGKTVPAETPAFPCGDEFYTDDEKRESVRYESDFAWFKPRTDLLLVGKCHTPEGASMQACSVTFQAGSRSRRLTVLGNRYWKRNALGFWKITEPENFTEMDLRYEKSFGGEGCAYNPVGKGFNRERDPDGRKIRHLPNIEDPNMLIDSPRRNPAPAGFGPLNRTWLNRQSKMGTYKGRYLKERWPWFPEDFDWGHFNAAPPEMQVEGYLRGDETLYFENLHPEHPQYHSRLPGIRVRCFLNKAAGPEEQEKKFEEVAVNLDTLWVDMEAEKLVLVWRGWSPVLSEEYEEVQDLFILSEPLGQPAASLEECRRRFLQEQAEQEKLWNMESEEPEPPAAPPEEETEPSPPAQAKPEIDQDLQAQADAFLMQMGIHPDSLTPEAREKQSQILQKLTETDPDRVAEMQNRGIDSQIRDAFARLDLDPDNPPPISARAQAEQMRFVKELGIKPADVAADPEMGKYLALIGAALPKMGIDPENLDPLIGQVKKQTERIRKQFGLDAEEEQAGESAETAASPLTREIVQERAARGESFAGEDLHGLNLSGLDLNNLDFSGAKLSGAKLSGVNLQSALLCESDLTEADLSEADLTGANLAAADLAKARIEKASFKDADLTGAILMESDLTGAILADAIFEKVRMAGAILDNADAKGANFSEADLTECRFRESSCPGADFSKSILDNADFRGADLSQASMEGTRGRKINMTDANLTGLRASEGSNFTGGIFWNTIGPGAIWEGSNLTQSDFRGARMEGAIFTGACLKQSDLSCSDMKFSRFDKANLQLARLVQMNLFQGNLEKADLEGANLSGSNMYGVEFLDAVVENIRVDGTNLKRTKLQE